MLKKETIPGFQAHSHNAEYIKVEADSFSN